MIVDEVELRCPVGARKLFAKLLLSDPPPVVTSSNLLEMSCQDCRRKMHREGDSEVSHVLHRFDVIGRLIETVIVRDPR